MRERETEWGGDIQKKTTMIETEKNVHIERKSGPTSENNNYGQNDSDIDG